MPHRFERASDWVAAFDDPGRDAWQKPSEVVAVASIATGMQVADLGAGTGYFLPHLSRAVGPSGVVHALDVEPDMVRHMTDRAKREGLGNVQAKHIRVDDPGLAAGSVDRVLVVNTWHHLDSRVDYAKKLLVALEPGGKLVVVDFTLESPKGPPPSHRIAPEAVVKELVDAGFRAEVVKSETLPDQYVVVGSKP
jgi:predicted methyltransferase